MSKGEEFLLGVLFIVGSTRLMFLYMGEYWGFFYMCFIIMAICVGCNLNKSK